MTIEELRIGNYVCVDNYPTNPQIVMGITHPEFNGYSRMEESDLVLKDTFDGHFYEVNIDKCDPIFLTEEWLVDKFGFEKEEPVSLQNHNWPDYSKGSFYISAPYFEFTYNYGDSVVEIKTVHRLQNLYYFLTGEELEVKP